MHGFEDFDKVVGEFMQEYGGPANILKYEKGEYDPTLGEAPTTETAIPVSAILLDLTLQSNGLSVKYGTLVQAGDKEAYIQPPSTSPMDFIPSQDKLKVGDIVYNIASFKEINTTLGRPVIYSLYLRR